MGQKKPVIEKTVAGQRWEEGPGAGVSSVEAESGGCGGEVKTEIYAKAF